MWLCACWAPPACQLASSLRSLTAVPVLLSSTNNALLLLSGAARHYRDSCRLSAGPSARMQQGLSSRLQQAGRMRGMRMVSSAVAQGSR